MRWGRRGSGSRGGAGVRAGLREGRIWRGKGRGGGGWAIGCGRFTHARFSGRIES